MAMGPRMSPAAPAAMGRDRTEPNTVTRGSRPGDGFERPVGGGQEPTAEECQAPPLGPGAASPGTFEKSHVSPLGEERRLQPRRAGDNGGGKRGCGDEGIVRRVD